MEQTQTPKANHFTPVGRVGRVAVGSGIIPPPEGSAGEHPLPDHLTSQPTDNVLETDATVIGALANSEARAADAATRDAATLGGAHIIGPTRPH